MDISEISSLLDDLPTGRSSYEFKNFFLESHLTPARQLVEVMKEMEWLHARINDLERTINPTEKFGIEHASESDNVYVRRELQITRQKYQQLEEWYNSISIDDRTALLSGYEQEEPTYWTNHLGRRAAIELLTTGRSSDKTMDMMSLMPQEDFEQAVRICTRYARLIQDITTVAESSIANRTGGMP